MSTKSIEAVMGPPRPHYVGDGFRVHKFIPSGLDLDMQRMSPFILMDYNSKLYFPPSDKPRGNSVRPHRGFEIVTIAYKGKVTHHDSTGNIGIIGEGDVHWMTAGAGILHKEYHENNFSKSGGELQLVRLWVNLPSKHKMSKPKYQEIAKDKMAKVALPDNGGLIEVIAGEFKGTKGTAKTFSPVHLQNARLTVGARVNFSFPENYNTALLVVEGAISINGIVNVAVDNFVLFENDGEEFVIEALENSIVLVMSGEPINEPIVAEGPFVMNTQAELHQAFEDFNTGKFGVLEE